MTHLLLKEMTGKTRHLIQCSRTGTKVFRIPLDREKTVRDASNVISSRLSKELGESVSVSKLFVGKYHLFEDDLLDLVVDEDEVITVEVKDAEMSSSCSSQEKIVEKEESSYKRNTTERNG